MEYPNFQKRSALSAADLNSTISALKRNRILPGVGIKLTETLNGTVVSLKPGRFGGSGTGTGTERRPWDIINLRGDGEPDSNGKFSNYKAEVWPGTVAGLMPSNLFSGGKLATFTVGATLQKWKARCLTNGKQITGVEIVVDANDPPLQALAPSALPAEAWFIFGLSLEGAAYRTIGFGNPSVTLNQVIVTDKTASPPPGIPGVDRWYQALFQ
jgi:hypothetical protein